MKLQILVTCGCGAAYTHAAWQHLPDARSCDVMLELGDGKWEQRTCTCGSSILAPIDEIACQLAELMRAQGVYK